MKSKYIFALTLSALMGLPACDNGMDDYLGDYDTIVYFKNDKVVEVSIPNVTESVTYEYPICKGGAYNDAPANVKIENFTQEDLKDYNQINGTDYTLLPAEYFTADKEVSFAIEDGYKTIKVTLNIKSMTESLDYKQTDYVVALKLSSDTKVNEGKNKLVILPNLTSYKVNWGEDIADNLEKTFEQTGDEPEGGYESYRFPFELNFAENSMDFTVDFVTDEATLTSEVEAYNTANHTNYELLPPANYDYPASVTVKDGDVSGVLTITPKNLQSLEIGEYILPVMMKSSQNGYFDVSSQKYYIKIKIVAEVLKELKLTTDMITLENYDNSGIKGLIDGNWGADRGDFWQAAWQNNTQGKPIGSMPNNLRTKENGILITLNLGKEYKKVKFSYVSVRANNKPIFSPYEIKLFDQHGNTLQEVSSGLPFNEDTWWDSDTFNNVSELNLAILKGYGFNNGDAGNHDIDYRSEIDANGNELTNMPCIISEIRVFVKE